MSDTCREAVEAQAERLAAWDHCWPAPWLERATAAAAITMRTLVDERDAALARATAAEAREAKLREALTRIAASTEGDADLDEYGAAEFARAALAEPARPAAEPPRVRIVTEPVASVTPAGTWRAYSPERRDLGSAYGASEAAAVIAFEHKLAQPARPAAEPEG